MLWRVLLIESILCLLYSFGSVVSAPGDDTPWLIIQTWAMSAAARGAILRFDQRGMSMRYAAYVSSMILFFSLVPGAAIAVPYAHQTLFVASAASLIFLLGIALKKKPEDPWRNWAGRGLFLFALPIAVQIWSVANIASVSFAERQAARGQADCLLIGKRNVSGYRRSQSLWDFRGLELYVPFENGGGSGSFQWTFHGLLLTKSGRLFNWSYQSLRFEPLAEEKVLSHRLEEISCSS